MPTNNFQQWNPPQSNQETDAAYTADSSRAGGAPVNSILPSPTFNKFAYQLSTMVAALAGYLVGQGQNASDTNLATLTAAIQAAIAAQIAGFSSIVSVPFSATPVFDASLGVNFEMTLTGNVTSSTLINTRAGQEITFIIHQDGTGGRPFVFPANVFSPGTVDPGASNTSVQGFIVDLSSNVRPVAPMTVS